MDFDITDMMTEAQFPTVKKRPWMDSKEFVLCTNENFAEIIDKCIASGRYSLDLETSGLDNRVKNGRTIERIAGVCLSPDGELGAYAPLRHVSVDAGGQRTPLDCNLDHTLFEREFRRLIAATEKGETKATFHFGTFDQEFLQHPHMGDAFGLWDKASTWDDTMILAYLRNTRARSRELKKLSEAPVDAPADHPVGGPGLGMEMIEIWELFGHDKLQVGFNYDFSTLDPREPAVLWYGGSDGICTWLLYPLLAKPVLNPSSGHHQKRIYTIEKSCVPATRWMERNQIPLNRDKVLELIVLGQEEWFESVMVVYQEAEKLLGRDVTPGYYKVIRETFEMGMKKGWSLAQIIADAKGKAGQQYPDPKGKVTTDGKTWPPIYDVAAPQQLGTMFDEMKVPGLKRTPKSGQIATAKDEIDRVIAAAGRRFPFMGKVKRFRETHKALTSYLIPMKNDADFFCAQCKTSVPSALVDTIQSCTDCGNNTFHCSMRIGFKAHKIDTGRFATPSGGKKRKKIAGHPALNIQSIPASYDPDRPACMTRLRECVEAIVGFKIVAIDFAGQELRAVTNLSLEPKWLAEFFHCSSCDRTFNKGNGKETPEAPPPRCPNCRSDKIGDLHTLTALGIFGEGARERDDWKQKRQDGKITNFALCYGGGGNAVQRATGCDKTEGWRIKRQFDASYSGLRGWWDVQHAFARQHGYVLTGFGRKYPVPDITHGDSGFRSKAERNSVNGPIQGTGADMNKIAMALAYKACKKRGWLNRVRMILTMHDELVFAIEDEILEEAIAVLVPLMTRNDIILKMNWPVPFTSDVEIGQSYAVPWDLMAMRHGEVKFIGDKKYSEKDRDKGQIPEGHVWETMNCYPEALKGLLAPPGQATVVTEPPSAEVAPSTVPESSEPPPNPQAIGAFTEEQARERPRMKKGDVFTYRLKKPLTQETLNRLAKVLVKVGSSGSRVLSLESMDGESLDAWVKNGNGGKPFSVNEHTFKVAVDMMEI